MGCSNNSVLPDISEFSPSMQHVMQPHEDLLRGINFNMNKRQIKRNETANFVKETPNSIWYDVDINARTKEFVDITYKFNTEEELIKIQLLSYFNSAKEALTLHREFKQYFALRYQQSNDAKVDIDAHSDININPNIALAAPSNVNLPNDIWFTKIDDQQVSIELVAPSTTDGNFSIIWNRE